MIISGGYIECFARITAANYFENQTHRWDLGPSMGAIDTSGIHKIPYTWTVTGGGANSYQSWHISGTSRNSNTQLYFQTLLAANTIRLFKYTSQFAVHHGAMGAGGIDSDAYEINYVPAELQWSSTYGASSFTGGTWFFYISGSRFFRFQNSPPVKLPGWPGATETTNIVPFYGVGSGSHTVTAGWYWEIDF
jgi:hypothetical protein